MGGKTNNMGERGGGNLANAEAYSKSKTTKHAGFPTVTESKQLWMCEKIVLVFSNHTLWG